MVRRSPGQALIVCDTLCGVGRFANRPLHTCVPRLTEVGPLVIIPRQRLPFAPYGIHMIVSSVRKTKAAKLDSCVSVMVGLRLRAFLFEADLKVRCYTGEDYT